MTNDIQVFKINTGARTATEICAEIVLIDALISSLLTTAITSVNNANVIEYEINTGQTKQRVEYSTAKQVLDAVVGYKRIRGMLRAELTPRQVRLMDSKNFNG